VVAKSTIMEYRRHSRKTVRITAGSVTDCPFYHLDAGPLHDVEWPPMGYGARSATGKWRRFTSE
jgi:hypothetical protein